MTAFRRKTVRSRRRGEDRERSILREAIVHFSEVGFAGNTSLLAKRLNVTQPLLYRYFASKEALIERVFQEVFLATWNPHWEEILLDDARSLEARLLEFHKDFARVHLVRERIRLALLFALRGQDMRWYFKLMRDRIYVPIAIGLRKYSSQPGIDVEPLHEVEVELAKFVIDKIQYYGIRKFVYEVPVPGEIDRVIEISVCALLDGVKSTMPDFLGSGNLYQFGKSPSQIWMSPLAGRPAADVAIIPKKRAAGSPGRARLSSRRP